MLLHRRPCLWTRILYGSVAKWSLQYSAKLAKKICGQAKGGGGRSHHRPPPLKYATALKSTVGGLRIAWSEATTTHNSNVPFPYYRSNRAFASILYSCSSKTKTIQCLPNPSQHVPIYLQYSFRVIRCLSQCVSPIKSLFSPHFCFPWGRPWGNHAKCCIDGKGIRCFDVCRLWRWCTLLRRLNFSAIFLHDFVQ